VYFQKSYFSLKLFFKVFLKFIKNNFVKFGLKKINFSLLLQYRYNIAIVHMIVATVPLQYFLECL